MPSLSLSLSLSFFFTLLLRDSKCLCLFLCLAVSLSLCVFCLFHSPPPAGVSYARHLTLFTLANSPAMRINIHNKIVSGEVNLVQCACCGLPLF